MKKILIIVLLMLMLVSMISCNDIGGGDIDDNIDEPGNDENDGETVESTAFETLNKLIQKKYSKVVIDVETVTNGVELTAKYSITNDLVEFEIEQLNSFPEDGSFSNASESYKKIITGTAKIKDGQVVEFDGESISMDSGELLIGAFDFSKENFKNVNTHQGGVFKADVIVPSNFFGTVVNASNMKVFVHYSESAIESMVISYNTNNSEVVITYSFTK